MKRRPYRLEYRDPTFDRDQWRCWGTYATEAAAAKREPECRHWADLTPRAETRIVKRP